MDGARSSAGAPTDIGCKGGDGAGDSARTKFAHSPVGVESLWTGQGAGRLLPDDDDWLQPAASNADAFFGDAQFPAAAPRNKRKAPLVAAADHAISTLRPRLSRVPSATSEAADGLASCKISSDGSCTTTSNSCEDGVGDVPADLFSTTATTHRKRPPPNASSLCGNHGRARMDTADIGGGDVGGGHGGDGTDIGTLSELLQTDKGDAAAVHHLFFAHVEQAYHAVCDVFDSASSSGGGGGGGGGGGSSSVTSPGGGGVGAPGLVAADALSRVIEQQTLPLRTRGDGGGGGGGGALQGTVRAAAVLVGVAQARCRSVAGVSSLSSATTTTTITTTTITTTTTTTTTTNTARGIAVFLRTPANVWWTMDCFLVSVGPARARGLVARAVAAVALGPDLAPAS
jgi:hypothetical protein